MTGYWRIYVAIVSAGWALLLGYLGISRDFAFSLPWVIGFLGFDFRRVRSLRGKWRPQYTPKLKKRTVLLRKLREVFRRYRSQPVNRVVEIINPILRGWVNYFAIGHSSRCFYVIKRWVELKVRRHLMRARKRQGFGWERWSTEWIHRTLGLFDAYRVRLDLRIALSTV